MHSCVKGQQTLKLKLNKPDVEWGHDSYGFAAADIRFAETRQHLPDRLANISEWMRNQLQSERLTGVLSAVLQLTEKWPHSSSLIPTFRPFRSILQHFHSFHSVCHLLSVHPSIHPGPMFSLLSGSGINLRSGFHFNSGLLTVEALHLCQWLHQAAGVICVSRHGDRLPVPHADIQSCSLF